MYVNSVVSGVSLAVFQLKLQKCGSNNFQGVSKALDKNEDKTVKLLHDPRKVSHKWTRARKLNTKSTSSILGTKLSAKDKGRLLINSNFIYFYNTNSSLEKKHTRISLPTHQTGGRNRD